MYICNDVMKDIYMYIYMYIYIYIKTRVCCRLPHAHATAPSPDIQTKYKRSIRFLVRRQTVVTLVCLFQNLCDILVKKPIRNVKIYIFNGIFFSKLKCCTIA